MKTYKIFTIGAALGVMMFAGSAFAATTATLSPETITVAPGAEFTVTVGVNPAGTTDDAEKMEIDYPANALEVVSFTQAPTWMALTQPGYDLNDTTNGVLIKTAGYPTGFSSATTFGTITFKAKNSTATGSITIGANSKAFQESSQSAISGNAVAFTIAKHGGGIGIIGGGGTIGTTHGGILPVSTTTTVTTPVTTPVVGHAPSVANGKNPSVAKAPVIQENIPLAASAIGTGLFAHMSIWFWLLLLLILLVISYVAHKEYKKRKDVKTAEEVK